MITKEFILRNEQGLHARPASLFSSLASDFKSSITLKVIGNDTIIDGKKVLSILGMRIRSGTSISVTASGSDETSAIEAIGHLIENDFE